MTHEIAKLRAVERYVLYKTSDATPRPAPAQVPKPVHGCHRHQLCSLPPEILEPVRRQSRITHLQLVGAKAARAGAAAKVMNDTPDTWPQDKGTPAPFAGLEGDRGSARSRCVV